MAWIEWLSRLRVKGEKRGSEGNVGASRIPSPLGASLLFLDVSASLKEDFSVHRSVGWLVRGRSMEENKK